MNEKIPYIRVGTTYYKLIERPQISGDKTLTLTKWSREMIIHDHNKKYIFDIPKYDGFCCIPNHLNYQKTVDNFYNIYYAQQGKDKIADKLTAVLKSDANSEAKVYFIYTYLDKTKTKWHTEDAKEYLGI